MFINIFTKVENIVDELSQSKYTTVLRNAKKIAKKSGNLKPKDLLLVDLCCAISHINLKNFLEFKICFRKVIQAFDIVDINLYLRIHFLLNRVLKAYGGNVLIVEALDQVVKQSKVGPFFKKLEGNMDMGFTGFYI